MNGSSCGGRRRYLPRGLCGRGRARGGAGLRARHATVAAGAPDCADGAAACACVPTDPAGAGAARRGRIGGPDCPPGAPYCAELAVRSVESAETPRAAPPLLISAPVQSRAEIASRDLMKPPCLVDRRDAGPAARCLIAASSGSVRLGRRRSSVLAVSRSSGGRSCEWFITHPYARAPRFPTAMISTSMRRADFDRVYSEHAQAVYRLPRVPDRRPRPRPGSPRRHLRGGAALAPALRPGAWQRAHVAARRSR